MTNIRTDSVDFFLGATTPAGFKGYFEPLRHEPGMQLYLIKSGPGCGKSTLMKHIAQAAEQKGERIEKIHCASDPDSLDGVIFPEKRQAILDATAPHTMEPDAPGADEVVVSLYHTIDAGKLSLHREEVKALFARNASLRSRAARYIASAGSPKKYFIYGFKIPGFFLIDKDGKVASQTFYNLGDPKFVEEMNKISGLQAPSVNPQATLQNDLLQQNPKADSAKTN